MSSHPFLPVPTGRLAAPSRQYYRKASDSPTRQQHARHIDDLISQLGPTTAVQALRSPSGSLKQCMDTATTSEQSFAMRAARASSNIQEWLDELSDWPWPEDGGSAGFEMPISNRSLTGAELEDVIGSSPSPSPARSTRGTPVTPEQQITRPIDSSDSIGDDGRWMGSLPTASVARYDKRITEIRDEIEELEVEDLKQHVLRHYILPMSPPDTPSFEVPLSTSPTPSSTASFAKMDDLTAVVSAIVLQALPQLSKLDRLMNIWRIRLLVLKRIPTLLDALDSAETAIQSAWDAALPDNKSLEMDQSSNAADLTRDEFAAMRSAVQQKVSEAAQITDFMLDSLDGREDTIPDDWIDRIDAVEHKYSEWVSLCERKVREAEWARAMQTVAPPKTSPTSELSLTPEREQAINETPEKLTPANEGTWSSLSSESPNSLLPSEPSLPQQKQRTPKKDAQETANSDETSPGSSPPDFRSSTRSVLAFNDMPTVVEVPSRESLSAPKTLFEPSEAVDNGDSAEPDLPQDFQEDPLESLAEDSFQENASSNTGSLASRRPSVGSEDDQLQQQISEILESIPANIQLSSQPSPAFNHLNPPDFKFPVKPKTAAENARSTSSMSSRSATPSFLLSPAFSRNARPRQQRGHQEIKLYHLSRSTGEAPIKLFIRLVGENGERVMVRVGGGWADLSEYLKEYASHHSRRSKSGESARVEIRDLPVAGTSSVGPGSSPVAPVTGRVGSSPPSRPPSALDMPRAMTPLNVRKTRRSFGDDGSSKPPNPRTPLAAVAISADTPNSASTTRSRSSSRVSWTEEDSTLGMSGPRSKNVEMSKESKAWVESVTEKVRIASGERKVSAEQSNGKFGELGKVGGTKRLFRKK